MYCQVIIDIVHENVASPFTYRIPEGMTLEPGQRVTVPFGKLKKEGIVLGLAEECGLEEKRVKDVIGPLEDYAAIPPELMNLAGKMAQEAHCPLAETLRLMLPAQMRGGRVRIKTVRTARLAVSTEEAAEAAGKEKRSRKTNRQEAFFRFMSVSPGGIIRNGRQNRSFSALYAGSCRQDKRPFPSSRSAR